MGECRKRIDFDFFLEFYSLIKDVKSNGKKLENIELKFCFKVWSLIVDCNGLGGIGVNNRF